MEKVMPIPVPESLHRKLKRIAQDRDIYLKTLIVEILEKAVTK
jgi:predicted HicB family RNase H-like nuclease